MNDPIEERWHAPDPCTCGKTVMCACCDHPWIGIREDGSHKAKYAELERLYRTPIAPKAKNIFMKLRQMGRTEGNLSWMRNFFQKAKDNDLPLDTP